MEATDHPETEALLAGGFQVWAQGYIKVTGEEVMEAEKNKQNLMATEVMSDASAGNVNSSTQSVHLQ